MKSPSWEANRHSASQEIPCPSWNLKVHYCVHNSPSWVPILSQMNPVHTFPPYFPKILLLYPFSIPISFQKMCPRPYTTFCNKLVFHNEEWLAPLLNPQAEGLSLVGCPQLLIQYICTNYPYLEDISSIYNPRTCHAVVTDIHITWTQTRQWLQPLMKNNGLYNTEISFHLKT
jgi:hypothetical protein